MTTEDLLNYLGLPAQEIQTLEDFKAKFPTTFVSRTALLDQRSPEFREILPHVAGKVTGSITSALNRALEEVKLELTPQEREGKKVEDLVASAITKLNARVGEKENKLAELQAKLESSKDEATRQLTQELQAARQRLADTENLLNTTRTTLTEREQTFASQLKDTKLEFLTTDTHAKAIKWRTGVKPVEQEGFFAHLNKNYKRDLDEQGRLIVLTASGERVPSKKQVGSFMTYEEVLEQEGKTLGVWEENPHARHQPALPTFGRPAPGGAAPAATPAAAPAPGGRQLGPRVTTQRLR